MLSGLVITIFRHKDISTYRDNDITKQQHKTITTMNQVVVDLWPVLGGSLLTGIISVLGMYFGWVHKLRTEMAVVEVELGELKRRVEGHSKKQDQILSAINNIQTDMNEKLNKIAIDIARINTTLTIIEPNKAQ